MFCSVYSAFIVLFCVLFVCKKCTVLLPPGMNPTAVNKYINIINISRAEVRNEWSYTTAPLYAYMAWTGTAVPLTLTLYLLTWRIW